MTADEALQFLREHQPLPPTREIDEAVLRRFDEVRRFFAAHADDRSVPLLLNSFGEGDGHGVYPLVEDAILKHPESVVVPALLQALGNPAGSVRYWGAQMASNYRRPELVAPLLDLLRKGSVDERMAAVTALEAIGTPESLNGLRAALDGDIQIEVKELIRDALGL